MIIAENITKYYQIQGVRKLIFADLSLQLHPGSRLALMGPNGAGKSTLLRLLCGTERPNRGRIIRTSRISWPIGVGSGFINNLTARENIKFICRLLSCDAVQRDEKIKYVQDFAEIGIHFDMPISTYSSGMKSRIAFGMSMAFDFDFYVVDETLAVGDPAFKKKSLQVFKEKSENKGLIMVSHSVNTIKQYCNMGIYLNQGKLVFSEDLNEIFRLYKATA
jgi:capsular polysaccharide transport system ATP-binding protein